MNPGQKLRKQINNQKQHRFISFEANLFAAMFTALAILFGLTPIEHISLSSKFFVILLLNVVAEVFRRLYRVSPVSKRELLDVQKEIEDLQFKLRVLEKKSQGTDNNIF